MLRPSLGARLVEVGGRASVRALAVLVALAVAMAAIPLPQPAPRSALAHSGDHETVRYLGGLPGTLDPAQVNDAGTAQIVLQLYAGLTRLDEEVEPYPSLAQSWEVSDDGRTYRFTMREGLRFSDGNPLDATDVRRSWLRLIDPETDSPGAAILADIEGAVAFAAGDLEADAVGINTPDPRTLVVTLAHPASYFPAVVSTPATFVVPRSADAGESWASARDFVGSGPYSVESVRAGEMTLRANRHYVHGLPAVDEVVVVGDLEDADPVTAFRDGDLDLTGVPPWDAAWIRYDESLGRTLYQADALNVAYFGFDTTRAPFDDARVRRAFLLALDRPRLAQLAGSGAEPASSVVPPALWPRGFEDDPPGRPRTARTLLGEAGYADPTDLGTITVVETGFGAAAAAETWRDELGVEVEIQSMALGDYLEVLGEEHAPEIFTVGWVADYPSPQALYALLLAPQAESNFGRWNDPRFVELLGEAAAAPNEAEQARGYRAVDEYVDEQAPVIPYTYGEDWWLVREGLRGARSLTLGLFDFGRLSWAE